jgi:hypothetical protein
VELKPIKCNKPEPLVAVPVTTVRTEVAGTPPAKPRKSTKQVLKASNADSGIDLGVDEWFIVDVILERWFRKYLKRGSAADSGWEHRGIQMVPLIREKIKAALSQSRSPPGHTFDSSSTSAEDQADLETDYE